VLAHRSHLGEDMTGETGETASAQERLQTPEERAKAIQDEIEEAKHLPDPTTSETYGKPNNEGQDG
jgi:hypothetical protein